ncbi:recombinase family protein [Sphingomonas sp. Leaf10]|uniref:recombinase family protein n=1 Tax=Sphingomonas sp. Leaf10 TaxID=1735676 RepID=UPI0009EC802B
MSTDHQRYSTENQADAISEYATRRGFDIVRTYADEGRSGLNIAGRESLKLLIDDVRNGRTDFTAILVYDISRWGRFQDADESGYYEFVCREAGITVHYCAEPFENDGSPSSTIMKSVRRVMAGEFSRDLSTKVFAGQCRLVTLGYRQGGPAGYGLRRQLVDEKGPPKTELRAGEQKSLQTDRVVLVPGPPHELETVRRIYRLFVEERRSEREIAVILNEEGQRTDLGRPWTRSAVHQILSNEKYVGNNVYNRVSFKLKKKRVVKPLPQIIDSAINQKRQQNTRRVIRDTLDTIEKVIRFEVVRLISCYCAVLSRVFDEIGYPELSKSIPTLALYLEVGASDRSMISFMSLGLSRVTAAILNDAAVNKSMTASEAQAWLKNAQLEAYNLSPILVKEIRRVAR